MAILAMRLRAILALKVGVCTAEAAMRLVWETTMPLLPPVGNAPR